MRSSEENWVELTTLLEYKGKTTLMKFIVDYIKLTDKLSYFLASAPNHNARKVLSSFIGLETYTVHRLLKIRPDTYGADLNFRRFGDGGADPLQSCRILMIDECSFIDDKLFDIIMEHVPKNCLIIALGNKDQLKPINPDNKNVMSNLTPLSPFFFDDRFHQLGLTEIQRSKSPVTLVGEAIRREKMKLPKQSYVDEEGNGVHILKNINSFLNKYFEYVKTPDDLKNNRMVAFSNRDVDFLNSKIYEILYDTKEPFVEESILVAQAPWIIVDNMGSENIIFDNGTFLKIKGIREFEEIIKVPEVNYEIEVTCFELDVIELDVFFNEEMNYNGNPKYHNSVCVLHPKDKDKYDKFIEDYRNQLNDMRKKKQRPDWKTFMSYRDRKFLDVKYLPVCTIHKSQGITVDNLFYYVDYVANMNDQDFARRLSYVAITRSRYNTFLLY